MSEYYIYIVPEEPGFVPDVATHEKAVAYFRQIAPKSGEIIASVSDLIEFIHCGENFGKIMCPSCRREVELQKWQEWMDQDYQDETKGFVLSRKALPCCGAQFSLHELNYESPQGFARFNISVLYPAIKGNLPDEYRKRFELILGCPVRVIYQHM